VALRPQVALSLPLTVPAQRRDLFGPPVAVNVLEVSLINPSSKGPRRVAPHYLPQTAPQRTQLLRFTIQT
jgi:hypothetical protein